MGSEAQFGRYDQAIIAFTQAASLDPNFNSPRINLGNAYWLSGNYSKAITEFQLMEKKIATSKDTRNQALISLSLSKCFKAIGNQAQAGDYYGKAVAMDSSLAEKYAYLEQASSVTSGVRAAQSVDESKDVMFAE